MNNEQTRVDIWPRWLTFLVNCKATNCMLGWPKWVHIIIWSLLVIAVFLMERYVLTVKYMASFYFLPLVYEVVLLPVWTDLILMAWGIGVIWISDWGNSGRLTVAMSVSVLLLIGGSAYFSRKLIKMLAREKALLQEREHLNEQLVYAFAKTIEYKDEYTMGHSIRVAEYARQVAVAMGLSQEYAKRIYTAGLLHDVGKIGVPEAILLKQGMLSDAERSQIQRHIELGVHILLGIPGFEDIVPMVEDHHERWDGGGYPHNKAGEDIVLGGRILAVADSYDAMTTKRVYREPVSHEEAVAELIRCSGGQFDPAVVRSFVKLAPPSLQIMSYDSVDSGKIPYSLAAISTRSALSSSATVSSFIAGSAGASSVSAGSVSASSVSAGSVSASSVGQSSGSKSPTTASSTGASSLNTSGCVNSSQAAS